MKALHLTKSQKDKLKRKLTTRAVIKADVDGTGRFSGCDEPEPYKMVAGNAVYVPCPVKKGELMKVEKSKNTVMQVKNIELYKCSNGHYWWKIDLNLHGHKQIYFVN